MEISTSQNILSIVTDKKAVRFDASGLDIDGLKIDMPGEYEKSGVLLQTRLIDGHLVHELQVERKIVGYVPAEILAPSDALIAFFDDLDVLLISGSKSDIQIFEALEARVVVPYGEFRDGFLQSVGQASLDAVDKYKSKEADFNGETTVFVKIA
jgi:hypothetical protein